MKGEVSARAAEECKALADVSRETLARLDVFEGLVRKWTRHISLVSPGSLPDIRKRHVCDSAQLFGLAPRDATCWVDLGSGGGFPGLVIAILAAEERPSMKVVMVESDTRKSVFLATAARTLGLECRIMNQRIEDDPTVEADVVSARALAPLTVLLGAARRWLKPEGVCLFPKGARLDEELTEARKCWHMDFERVPSISDPAGTILLVTEFHHADRP